MLVGTDGGKLTVSGPDDRPGDRRAGQSRAEPPKILKMATWNAALFVGRDSEMGLVREGYEADLVILNANPLIKVANLRDIGGVVRAGYLHSAADLGALLADAARSAGKQVGRER